MNTATKNLENDHIQILRLIEVMEQITQSADPNPDHLEQIVMLIREFADGFHHAKEEQLLFPLMVKKGFSTESGPVAVMLHDHVQGRNFVTGMADNIAVYRSGEKDALKSLYSNMLGYCALLKNHIAKENNVLFRMADNAFSEADQASLIQAFERVEQMQENGRSKSEYTQMITTLLDLYSS